MKLSKRGEYALRALVDLGTARELGRPLVSMTDLSEKENKGAYAFVRGATLTEALAKPALPAAAKDLPLASSEVIDQFSARNGLISQGYEGVLSNPAELKPLPFKIIFETPQSFPITRQVAAAKAALGAILREYRQFIAYGQNL